MLHSRRIDNLCFLMYSNFLLCILPFPHHPLYTACILSHLSLHSDQEVCEFYNCSEESNVSCYHGYIACAEHPSAVGQHINHSNHFCEAAYRKDEATGLYGLYRKGCAFDHPQVATACTSDCHVDVFEGDDTLVCCCDGQLCNVNVTFSDPSKISSFGKSAWGDYLTVAIKLRAMGSEEVYTVPS